MTYLWILCAMCLKHIYRTNVLFSPPPLPPQPNSLSRHGEPRTHCIKHVYYYCYHQLY